MKEYYKNYFKQIKEIGPDGTEHSYRTHFENLLHQIKSDENIRIIHEPKRTKGFGAPDFRMEKNGAVTGYIETKKPDENLDKIRKSEQIKKYLHLSDNLVLTNYRKFMLFKNGNHTPADCCDLFDTADLENRKSGLSENSINATDRLFSKFFMSAPAMISDAKELAVCLADRGKILAEYISEILEKNEKDNFSQKMQGLYKLFRETLVKDLKQDEFADAYAQTVIYGLFLARLQSGHNSIRLSDASRFIPVSFSVIKEFFSFIRYDYTLPNHVAWIFTETANLINHIDLKKISQSLSFGKTDKSQLTDPYLYFYETFLAASDPQKRKSKGVYYTPPPVVHFIIGSIDRILSEKFSMPAGFADSSVTVLDFAAGTGTFLVAVFERILHRIREKDAGSLKGVIHDHILKNFYGFEYMAAPYAVAHLKLSQLLKDNGYEFDDQDRLQIYLTDTLDDSDHETNTLLPVVSAEGKEANRIKIEKQILVITGNPPYSNRSTGKKIEDLIKDYKPEGEKKLNLNDDYIKFIRFAHNKMEKIQQGVIGIITNNSFLNGLTHRRMRGKLAEDFDEIYILNLHGNARIGETCPDGSIDQNVFDIKQGVSISIFVKTGKQNRCRVFYSDLYGTREHKYDFLASNDLKTVKWEELRTEEFDKSFRKTRWGKNRFKENLCFFVPVGNIQMMKDYGKFWGITEIFKEYNSGIQTKRDSFTIHFSQTELQEVLADLKRLTVEEIRKKYKLPADGRDWTVQSAKESAEAFLSDKNHITRIHYRAFDLRWTYCNEKSKGFLAYPRYGTMKHFLNSKNMGLCFIRNDYGAEQFTFAMANDKPADIHFMGGQTYTAPLYLHESEDRKCEEFTVEPSRGVNFTEEFRNFIKTQYHPQTPTPEQIFAYIYAVMYCPVYRQVCLEFLKMDFSRIPFAPNYDTFLAFSRIGTELIAHHLMKESCPDCQVSFPCEGEDAVEQVRFIYDENTRKGSIFINKNQYFGNIPVCAWEFCAGGYQVLDKWLKSRKNRMLTYQEKEHFKKIVSILDFTDKCMHKIENLWKETF